MKEKGSKSKETKQKILTVALRLFVEKGYEKSTMREIASQAQLAPGAAYYYFPSKDHIIFHYYTQCHEDHLDLADEILSKETSLEKRISGVVKANIQVAQPYHEISRILFKTAADPTHPLSPFSEQSRTLRDKDTAVFQQVIQGGDTRVPEQYIERLPRLLWLYKMGIVLYWIFDKSENQKMTFELIEQTSALIVKLIKISKLPVLQSLVNQMVTMIEYFVPK